MTNLSNEVMIKDLPDILVASIRVKGKYSDVGKYFGKIYRYCGKFSNGTPFSLYYDQDYKKEDADMEICVPVKSEVNKDEVRSRILSGGKALTFVHKGSYDTIDLSYKILFDYVKKHNLQIKTPVREIYLKGPGMIFRGNPKKYLTEIQLLLE